MCIMPVGLTCYKPKQDCIQGKQIMIVHWSLLQCYITTARIFSFSYNKISFNYKAKFDHIPKSLVPSQIITNWEKFLANI